MTTLTLSIREYPKDKQVEISELTENGLLEMMQECDTLKDRLEDALRENRQEE